MKNRPRERRPKRADRRAEEWLLRTTREAAHSGREKSPATERALSLSAYIVNRAVRGSTPDGIFERPDLMDFLQGDHGAKVFPNFHVSLISPAQGIKLTRGWQGEPDDLRQKLEKETDLLPNSQSGSLAHPIITGTAKGHEGPRFVGYVVDQALQGTMREERKQIIAATGRTVLAYYKYTPHLTLFETKNQGLAEELKRTLGGFLEEAEVPLELGPAAVIPISNKRVRFEGA